jgi:hypothetical protein
VTTSDIVTLAVAVIAIAGSALSIVISTKKERSQLIWKAKLDRFFALEALAGELTEVLGGYSAFPADATELVSKIGLLEQEAGRFGRYSEVRQGIRDLHHLLSCMFVAKRDHESEQREIRSELQPTYRKLLNACDKALGRSKTLS